MAQNFKIALIIIRFIVESFEDFGSLERGSLKKNSSGFRLACVKNQREIKSEMKNAAFYSFRDVEISIKKEKMYPVNNFYWMIVKLCTYAT